MSEPRIRPLSDDQADGTQALLIASAEHNGAPDLFAPGFTSAQRLAETGCATGTNF